MAHKYTVILEGTAIVSCEVDVYADSEQEAIELAMDEYEPYDIEVDNLDDWSGAGVIDEDVDDILED